MSAELDFGKIKGPRNSPNDNFEELIAQLVCRIHSDGSGVSEPQMADEGLDAFSGGSIRGPLHVFQAKYYLDALTPARWVSIRKSLKRALACHEVASWTLCIPKNLSPSELRAFDELSADYPGVRLKQWGGSRLREQLAKNRDLIARFFEDPLGPLGRFVLWADHPDLVEARELVVAPPSFMDRARRLLESKGQLLILGPPHVGKSSLARRLALELFEGHRASAIVECGSDFFTLLQGAFVPDIQGLVFIAHDAVDYPGPRDPARALTELAQRNLVLMTARTDEFRQARLLLPSQLLRDISIQLEPGEYSAELLDQILCNHLRANRGRAPLAPQLLAAPDLRALVVSHLSFPHNIERFVTYCLPAVTAISRATLEQAAEAAADIKRVIESLYVDSTYEERLFLALCALLDRDPEATTLKDFYDGGRQILSGKFLPAAPATFEVCREKFETFIKTEPARTPQYSGGPKTEPALVFSHPSYRHAILQVTRRRGEMAELVYPLFRDLVTNQEGLQSLGHQRAYDLSSLAFETLTSEWDDFGALVSKDVDAFLPYRGRFDDALQASYGRLLWRLGETIPDRVLDECEAVLGGPLVERNRYVVYWGIFSAGLADPERAISLVLPTIADDQGEEGDTLERELGPFLASVYPHDPEVFRPILQATRRSVRAVAVASLMFMPPEPFREIGVDLLESFFADPWEVKGRFRYLYRTGQFPELPFQIKAIAERWEGSWTPARRGYLSLLLHANLSFAHGWDSSELLPLLETVLDGPVDPDNEMMTIDLILSISYDRQELTRVRERLPRWIEEFVTDVRRARRLYKRVSRHWPSGGK